jgi:hypothetical protein
MGRKKKTDMSSLPDAPSTPTERAQERLREIVTAERIDPHEAATDVRMLAEFLSGLAKKTVVVVFALGKVLSQVKDEIPHGQFVEFIKNYCPFDERSAQRYMRIYEQYKDVPTKQLADVALSEAYVEAGIKKLAAPQKKDAAPPETGHEDLHLPKIEEFEPMFRQAPASGISLEHYRVAAFEDGIIHAMRPELGVFPVAHIFLSRGLDRPEARAAFLQAEKDICIALEIYYKTMEELEDKGLVPKIEDRRFTTAIRRSRGLPEAPEKTRKRRSK